MNKININKVSKDLQLFMVKKSPEILTGIGITGMVTTVILAVKATPKAMDIIQYKEIAKGRSLRKDEIIKETWKCYIPAVVTGSLSIACLVCASSENTRRNAALATAFNLSETALREYQSKVVETIGEKKEQTIRDSIAKDKIEKNSPSSGDVILTDRGNTLCYDVTSGRYFKADIDKIKKAVNDLNRIMRDEMYISLNQFYDQIGLDHTSVGEDIGWNIDRGYIDLRFSSQLTKDEEPCLVIDYKVAPKAGYYR